MSAFSKDQQSPSGADESLPPRLLADLSALYPPPPRVSSAMDQRVMRNAAAALRGQAHRIRRWSLRWVGAAGGAAAAAAVLLVALRILHTTPLPTPAPASQLLAGDVDGNGKVDILDAFAVARDVHHHDDQPVPANAQNRREDFDGNHVIDQADVEAIARLAVRVAPTGTRVSSARTDLGKAGGGNVQ